MRKHAASTGGLLLVAFTVSIIGATAATAARRSPHYRIQSFSAVRASPLGGDGVGRHDSLLKWTGSRAVPVVNDGLPKQWIGVTGWTAGYFGVPPSGSAINTTVANVTLTLAKKAPYTNKDARASIGKVGTLYTYVPSGKITVVGWCGYMGTPITVAMKPTDGQLLIFVPKDKRLRAAYVGSDNEVLTDRQPRPCPDGSNQSGPGVAYWGFRTEFGEGFLSNKRGERYRHRISAAAPMLSGTYVENDTLGAYQPLDKYEWCFVRDRRNLGKCG